MTKFLSDCLQAPEPFFRHGLKRLEALSGNPSHDIKLSLEVNQAAKHKLMALGIDPNDTTAEEVYYLLQEKVRQDDAKLVKALRTLAARHVSAEGEVVAGMVHALKALPDSKRGYALKTAAFKSLIKKLPPKKAMKQLGYRSLDSFLKHESAANILVAAKLYETAQWHSRLMDSYKKLRPGDFEDRQIEILQPGSYRWRQLSEDFVAEHRHNLLSLRELGVLILLPLPHDAPAGTVTTSLSLALHELNEIRAASSYLKLSQVRSNFGEVVQLVANDQPQLDSHLLNMSIPWQLIQRYYSRLQDFGSPLGDLHLQIEDLAWHSVESAIQAIEPTLNFWQDSSHLAILHGNKAVSFNLVDVALNACNNHQFENRLSHYFQNSLWHELLLRYLNPEAVSDTILHQLQPQLSAEMALA